MPQQREQVNQTMSRKLKRKWSLVHVRTNAIKTGLVTEQLDPKNRNLTRTRPKLVKKLVDQNILKIFKF